MKEIRDSEGHLVAKMDPSMKMVEIIRGDQRTTIQFFDGHGPIVISTKVIKK